MRSLRSWPTASAAVNPNSDSNAAFTPRICFWALMIAMAIGAPDSSASRYPRSRNARRSLRCASADCRR